MSLPSSFFELLLSLSPTFTSPTFQRWVTIVSGWLFAQKRTVTGIIQAAGVAGKRHHAGFHRFFSQARWSLDTLGFGLFELIRPFLVEGDTVFLAADDTLARKRGLKVFGVGMHHDPLLSSRGMKLVNWGHNWVVLGVLVRFPFRPDSVFCLPILFRLYRSRQTNTKAGLAHKTRPELLVELLDLLCAKYADLHFHLTVDSSYSGESVIKKLPENCDLTGRLHMDAQLFAPAPPRKKGTMGRPRKKGERLPSPRKMLQGNTSEVALDIYGRKETARMEECQALWYGSAGQRLLKIVAVEPLDTGRKTQAFFSTCADLSAIDILTIYAMRWAIEVTFQESKGRLGFEEPQGWSRNAVERTAPMAMVLYSLIVLWFAKVGHRHLKFPVRPWYRKKKEPSFADMVTTLRRQSLRRMFLETPEWTRGTRKVFNDLMDLYARAA